MNNDVMNEITPSSQNYSISKRLSLLQQTVDTSPSLPQSCAVSCRSITYDPFSFLCANFACFQLVVIETPNILILRDSFRQKPLKPPSDKPMLIVSNRLKTTMMSKGMTTLTEPSSSGTRRLMSANDESMPLPTEQLQQRQLPNVHPEDSFLYCMPKGVHPTYRAVPLVVKLSILVLAMWTSAVTTWKRLTWLQPLAILGGLRQKPTVAQILSFVTKTLLLTIFSQCLVQDIFLSPSRLSIDTLREQYFLPSSLSKYEQVVSVLPKSSQPSLGVHYLKYTNTTPQSKKFDAVYTNHGFGASSLSWLPALPSLVHRLGAKVGLGHDAVGFGFTDRPNDDDENIQWYTTGASASIGTQLLLPNINCNDDSKVAVALFGHSLGALTTLKMALKLPRETSKFIVLSAPALGIRKVPQKKQSSRQLSLWRRAVLKPVTKGLQNGIAYPVFGYALRRIVGAKNSWKLGLQSAWGNPKNVRESDVVRFQWPSIGAGWERGLFHFARAQSRGGEAPDDRLEDNALLRQVLELPNTKVVVVLGSSDKVIPSKLIRKFLQDFKTIPVVELEGLGHDAFEEDIEGFLGAVEQLLQDHWDKQ